MKMSSGTRALVSDFRQGYGVEPVPNRIGRWFVVGPDGERLRNPDSSPIVIGKESTPGRHHSIRMSLISVGAIQKPRKIERGDTEKKKGPSAETSALIPSVAAEEVLKDTRTTPRERGMAREVLRLTDEVSRLQAELLRTKEAAQVFYARFEDKVAS